MAVINVRVDDHVRDQLKEMADAGGVTLSDCVRDLLLEAVVPIFEREVAHGDEPAPTTMRVFDRQVLSMLHRILARVLPEDANDVDGDAEYQLMRARILEDGYAGEYWLEVAGFRTELSKRDCGRVSDLLQMFRVVTFSIDRLANDETPIADEVGLRLEFRGFDHNDPLEHHMARYVEHLMSEDRWTELRPQLERNDGGNSHLPMLDMYMRMLAEYRRIMDSRSPGLLRSDYLLSHAELERIADAGLRAPKRSRT